MKDNLKLVSLKKPWGEEEINRFMTEVMNEATSLGIPYSKNIPKKVIINRRAKTRFGCCKKIRKGLKISFEIELSEKLLLGDEKMVKQTLAHELLHTCPGCDNHGIKWKSYAQKFNYVFGYQIKRTGNSEELGLNKDQGIRQLKENYLLVCKNCGAKIARTRMSPVIKNPNHYRCKCGGRLERVK